MINNQNTSIDIIEEIKQEQITLALSGCKEDCTSDFKKVVEFKPTTEDEQYILDLVKLLETKGIGELEYAFLKEHVAKHKLQDLISFYIQQKEKIVRTTLIPTIKVLNSVVELESITDVREVNITFNKD